MSGSAIALTPLERVLAFGLYAVYAAALGWLVLKIDAIDEKREANHMNVIERVNDANRELTKSISDLRVEYSATKTTLDALKEKIDARPVRR